MPIASCALAASIATSHAGSAPCAHDALEAFHRSIPGHSALREPCRNRGIGGNRGRRNESVTLPRKPPDREKDVIRPNGRAAAIVASKPGCRV